MHIIIIGAAVGALIGLGVVARAAQTAADEAEFWALIRDNGYVL